MKNTIVKIFQKGSQTYFNSSRFFPTSIKKDVFILYSFVRTADDLVDKIPSDKKAFLKLKANFIKCYAGEKITDTIVKDFVNLVKRKKFDQHWVMAFLSTMETDLRKKQYRSMNELNRYMYGSAEVIGLMMCQILQLPKSARHYARNLAKSMQYINFIRDIWEDYHFRRTYMPQTELKKFGLTSLEPSYIKKNQNKFIIFIRSQIDYYFQLRDSAQPGFRYIPRQSKVAIKTADQMYLWTAKKIYQNPNLIFRKKVKPSKFRILFYGIKNYLWSK